ncbi:hypothetical protein Acr_14g0002820 [Actinidia rufa]|uniref:Uncharacterized protein n=1 Tax=Actinidia rufa TaxID=165716 RepID=A0A7J0FQI5_9ERIC|nr:hypothetical protein Acr_14g0002820 [Actinidia rufa]
MSRKKLKTRRGGSVVATGGSNDKGIVMPGRGRGKVFAIGIVARSGGDQGMALSIRDKREVAASSTGDKGKGKAMASSTGNKGKCVVVADGHKNKAVAVGIQEDIMKLTRIGSGCSGLDKLVEGLLLLKHHLVHHVEQKASKW